MSNKRENYHIYSHTNPEIKNLGDFVAEQESLGNGLSIVDLLNYQDENDHYNLDNLLDLYSTEEKKKYDSLIKQVINQRTKKPESTTATSSTSNNAVISPTTVAIDKSQSNPKTFIKYKKGAEQRIQIQLKNGDLTFLDHPSQLHPSTISQLNKLYDNTIKLLFLKFIYQVETNTPYKVLITGGADRSISTQKKLQSQGSAFTEYSDHMTGLALDVNLIHNRTGIVTDNTLDLNKDSTNEEWVSSGAVKYAEALGLRWGGKFSQLDEKGRTDKIHFDCAGYFDRDKDGYMKAIGLNKPETPVESSTQDNSNSIYFDLPIHIGTVLNLSLDKVNRLIFTTETNQTVNMVDYESFLAKELIRLLSDKGYKRVFTPTNKKEQFKGTVQEIYPHISVWVWSRAMSIESLTPSSSGETRYEHQLINITPYITSLNTNVAENGGNFNLTISPIVGEVVSRSSTNKGWGLKTGSQKDSKNKDNKYHVNSGHMHYVEKDELKRSNFFFEKALQANDIVFIKFEQLEMETNREDLNDLEVISIDKLPGQVFDMIALVDNINISSSFESVDVNIAITGRDLVKLLIEDGVYFYASQFTDSGMFANTGATNNRLLRYNGQIKDRFQESNRSIDKSLKFIMNNLGEIEICPTNLFDSYGDKVSNFYQLTDKNSAAVDDQLQKVNDKKKSILKKINKVRSKNDIYDKNDTSGNKVYNLVKNFLSSLIDDKTITVVNQEIVSWKFARKDGLFDNNRIIEELDGTLIHFNRYWRRDDKGVLNKLDQASTTSLLESLYDKTDKNAIIENNLLLFNNLSRNLISENRKDQLHSTAVISIDNILSELNTYIKSKEVNSKYDDVVSQSIFKQSDINQITDSYKNTLVQGHTLSLVVIYKLFTELTIDEKAIFNDTYNLIIEERSIKKDVSTSEKLTPMLGIWQIIKLVIDDSVKSRRLTDVSIGNENGSLLNAFRKICQDPFCEFYTDTYGDQFYFIARKKPFDYESIKSMMDSRIIYEVPQPIDTSKNNEFRENEAQDTAGASGVLNVLQENLILDIEEKDVINDSLSYSTEAYSWYKLNLVNLTSGSASDMAFAYLKAIYFEEFADIYGSKPLDLSTSYIPYSPVIDKDKKLPQAYFIKQGVYDLKYMIESHAHLPFTRTGTITMNGDRRIKRGTFIRYKGTNEIFYVDSVSHSYSISETIDRTTTLQVSRGMVEDFIDGVDITIPSSNVPQFRGTTSVLDKAPPQSKGSTVKMSYFNICDLPIDKAIFEDSNSSYSAFSEGSLAQWKVNKEVFNFFLKKLQFSKTTERKF
jgi:uncharacterized protein YcbK (DUF882 family)